MWLLILILVISRQIKRFPNPAHFPSASSEKRNKVKSEWRRQPIQRHRRLFPPPILISRYVSRLIAFLWIISLIIGRNKLFEFAPPLQPFFLLHKAPSRKPSSKTRRKIDLSPKASDASAQEYNDNSRFETFKLLWSNTESIIKVFPLYLQDPTLLIAQIFSTLHF